MSSSSQIAGSCSFLMPSRSIRWPPVILISGTSCLSATSAIRRSSSAVVTPPRMRGTTRERAVVLDVRVDAVVDEARVALLAVAVAADLADQVGEAGLARAAVAARRRRRRSARTRDSRPRSRTTAASSSRVWRRQGQRSVASSAAPPRSIASSSPTSGLHEPQPAPARVTLTTSSVEPSPRVRIASTISPLQTPWQLHTRALSGRSAAVACEASASSASGSLASRPVRTASISSSAPRDVAEQDRADRAALAVDRELAVACARRRRRPRGRRPGCRRRRGRRPSPSAWPWGSCRCTASPAAQRARLLVDRRDDAVHDPAVLGALADREHARVRGRQVVVDHDPAVDRPAPSRGRARPAAGCRPRSRPGRPRRTRRRRAGRRAAVISSVLRSSSTSTPSASIAGASSAAAPPSSWRSIRRSMRCTTVTSQPSEASPYAASRPSRPPPMTTARRPAWAAIAAQSSGPRKTWACSAPGIGGTSASEPVHRTTRS